MNSTKYEKVQLSKPDPEVYPNTVSKSWINIDEMSSINKFNQTFLENLISLKKKHFLGGWKKSRGDGNCYYRSVISTYFLTVTNPNQPIERLKNLLAQLKSLNLVTNSYDYTNSIRNLINQALSLLNAKYTNPIKVFEEALELVQNTDFDLDLIRFARLMTWEMMVKCKDDENFSFLFLDGIDSIRYDILEMNKEGGEFSLIFLPKGLGIQVIQYMYLENPTMSVQKFPEDVLEGTIVVNIIRRENHYDILCKIQEIEDDQYDITEGAYYFVKYV